jgi:hypothetical protein
VLALALVVALAAPAPFQLPDNITVTSQLRAIVLDAIRASPTFREQCARIGRMRLVRAVIDIGAGEYPRGQLFSRAHTDIRRYQYGLIIAAVHLVSIRDAAELVAHELEHVREFAEGVDYRVQAVRTPRAVWQTGPNTFESSRAVSIGRIVAEEIAMAGPPGVRTEEAGLVQSRQFQR